jgi:hypothetical protein
MCTVYPALDLNSTGWLVFGPFLDTGEMTTLKPSPGLQ